jgi:putative membrane protein
MRRRRASLALWSLVTAGVAAAHEVPAHDIGRLPSADAWNAVTALSLALLSLWYLLGFLRLRRRRAGRTVIPAWRLFAFSSSVAATAMALLSPLDRSSDTLFSAHMMQHEILMLVSAPLMVFGRPFIAAVWALGPVPRKVIATILRLPWLARFWRLLSGPFAVLLLHGVILWGWHVPWMFELALHHEGIHVIQHLSFFVTAALFWWALIHGCYGRLGYGVGLLYVFATALHSEVLAALLTFTPRFLYATHAARTAAQGLDPIVDQQLAGVLMWIPFGAVFVIIGVALFAAWLGESERRVTAAERARTVNPS